MPAIRRKETTARTNEPLAFVNAHPSRRGQGEETAAFNSALAHANCPRSGEKDGDPKDLARVNVSWPQGFVSDDVRLLAHLRLRGRALLRSAGVRYRTCDCMCRSGAGGKRVNKGQRAFRSTCVRFAVCSIGPADQRMSRWSLSQPRMYIDRLSPLPSSSLPVQPLAILG